MSTCAHVVMALPLGLAHGRYGPSPYPDEAKDEWHKNRCINIGQLIPLLFSSFHRTLYGVLSMWSAIPWLCRALKLSQELRCLDEVDRGNSR